MEITGSIIDYIGKFEGGILVSIGLMYRDTYHDSIFYYTADKMLLTVDDSLIKALGSYIEEHSDYLPLMKSIIEQCEPFENMFDQLQDIETSEE